MVLVVIVRVLTDVRIRERWKFVRIRPHVARALTIAKIAKREPKEMRSLMERTFIFTSPVYTRVLVVETRVRNDSNRHIPIYDMRYAGACSHGLTYGEVMIRIGLSHPYGKL